jgi:Zn-dependent peptidase ImmA (M78 family)
LIWKHAHQEAMFAVAEFHDDYGIDATKRIDVFTAIDDVDLDLFFRPIGAAGLYLPRDLFEAPGIVLNSDHPLALQRYSGAHELGHHHFGHEPDIDLDAELVARPDRELLSDEEKLAEAFASWFLAPPELVDLVLEQLSIERPRSPHDVYQLALRLGTSYMATCYHLSSMGLLGGTPAHDWAQRELRKIKEAIAPQRRPEGWHNDVWLLGDGDRRGELIVRAGDRLVVHGTWTVEELPAGATLAVDQPPTLFADAADTVVDIARDAPRGQTRLALSAADDRYVVALDVARPHFGKYMPAAPACQGAPQ